MTYRQLQEEARSYYALCAKAERLGIPTSLDDARTPATVDALRAAVAEAPECEGHPAGPFDPMGETVYCDGSCQR